MKRFEVEVGKNSYCIVLFERTKMPNAFLYTGKAYVSGDRAADVKEDTCFLVFSLQEMIYGGSNWGRLN